MPHHLVQLQNGPTRHVALVKEPSLVLLNYDSTYDLISAALQSKIPIAKLIEQSLDTAQLPYDPIYLGQSDWRLIPPLDHPTEPSRLLVSGTGLTHLGSAKNRNAMHENAAQSDEHLTDSMKMFRWGVEGGKPPTGQIGISPEWFYKGTGADLRAHNDPLDIPDHAEDGGEEAELVGLYIIDPSGRPVRIGMAQGNEFSDHIFEKRNYLNLAGSKLRTCSIGPELVLAPDFSSIHGSVTIERNGGVYWTKPIATGESEMCHSLANIEHHHFKFAGHRRPGDLHVHYFGAHSLSFGDKIHLRNDDIMEIQFEGFGRPLRNPVRAFNETPTLVSTIPLA
jgi:hypothetical protein